MRHVNFCFQVAILRTGRHRSGVGWSIKSHVLLFSFDVMVMFGFGYYFHDEKESTTYISSVVCCYAVRFCMHLEDSWWDRPKVLGEGEGV